MEIKVRQASENDLSHILVLYDQLEMNNDHGMNIEEAVVFFNRFKLYPDYKVYVAEYNGAIVGTFALAIMDNMAHKGLPSGLIEDVVVDLGVQGKGIGKKMMTYAIDYCREKGCYKLALSTNLKRENAHKFYESLGFKRHGYSYLIEI